MEGLFVDRSVGNAVDVDDVGAVNCLMEVTNGRVVGTLERRIVGEKLGDSVFGTREGLAVGTTFGAGDGTEERLPVGDREGTIDREGYNDDGNRVRINVGIALGVGEEGAIDGFLVGPSDDGATDVSDDGWIDGILDGQSIGEFVFGPSEGRHVGDSDVGAIEGFIVGISDGWEGRRVGDSDVGAIEGFIVGISDGWEGRRVGDRDDG